MQGELTYLSSVKRWGKGASMIAVIQWVPLTCSTPATQPHTSIESFGSHGEVLTVNTGSRSVFNDMVSHPSLTHGSGSPGEHFCARF